MKFCGVPAMVTVIRGMRVSFGESVPPQGAIGKELVAKFPGWVWVRMTDPFAGMVKLPHKLNCAVGRSRSTVTHSTFIGAFVGLSIRMAPAPVGLAAPMKTTFGAPAHGVGKFSVEEELSAKPRDRLPGVSPMVPGGMVT